jgi:F0F1-type ATP synthase membrane subunit b/b'
MKRFQQLVRGFLRRYLVDPLLSSVFERFDRIERRLDRLEGRLDELQGVLEEVSARSSARTEAANAAMESGARAARRLEEIERILGAR